MPAVIMPDPLPEDTTATLRLTLVDEDDVPVPASGLTALTLTYYDLDTLTILNDRQEQDILNANNVTMDSAGVITWALQQEDTAIVSPALGIEWHRALFTWCWSSGNQGRHEVDIGIENLTYVPEEL